MFKCRVHIDEICPRYCAEMIEYVKLPAPACFYCPITLEIMQVPVVDQHGFSYEQAAYQKAMQRDNTKCVLTNKPFARHTLDWPAPINWALKEDIDDWWIKVHNKALYKDMMNTMSPIKTPRRRKQYYTSPPPVRRGIE